MKCPFRPVKYTEMLSWDPNGNVTKTIEYTQDFEECLGEDCCFYYKHYSITQDW